MDPKTEALARMHVQDDDPIPELRLSYPELDFVFDRLEELQQLVDDLLDTINTLEDHTK